MTCQLLIVLHGHESRDGGGNVHHLRLLVRGFQRIVPLVDELAGVCFLGQGANALIGGIYAQKSRKRIRWGFLRLCQSENFYRDDAFMLLELFKDPC